MITVHKLHGEPLVLNAELIETVEAVPDTLITLVNHRRVVVSESVDEVVEAVVRYRRRIGAVPLAAVMGPAE